jgi:hypothetical protein
VVQLDHRLEVVAAPAQVLGQLVVRQQGGVDGLHGQVCGNGGGLDLLVPAREVLPPEPLGERARRRRDPSLHLLGCRRPSGTEREQLGVHEPPITATS